MRNEDAATVDDDRHRRTATGTGSAAVVTDGSFRIVELSDAGEAMTGYSHEAITGESPAGLFDDPDRFARARAVADARGRWSDEITLRTRDDRLVPADCTVVRIDSTHASGAGVSGREVDGGDASGRQASGRQANGSQANGSQAKGKQAKGSERRSGRPGSHTSGSQPAGGPQYVFTFVDRTRRRQYEQGIRIFDRVLRHNLRNDANVVIGHLENALESASGDQRESLRCALEGVERLLSRSETARSFSDVFSPPTGGPLESVRIDRAADRVLTAVDTTGVAVDRRLSDVAVVANETLEPAIRAILENALEHNDAPVPKVEVHTRREDDRGILRVADNGPGIRPEYRDRAFGREEESQVHHGNGLSLFFVDRLMELYGGRARVHERDDRGAVFELRFRLAE